MNTITTHEIFKILDGVRLVRYRADQALLFVWKGGHTVNVYDPWWRNVDVFDVGRFARIEEVESRIREWCSKTGIPMPDEK